MTALQDPLEQLIVLDHERLIGHEAAHAAAAVCLGYSPVEIVAISSHGGHVQYRPKLGREVAARDALLIALAGRIEEDNWPPAWPPSEQKSSDERHAAVLVKALGLNEADWNGVALDLWGLASSSRFRLLEKAFSTALEDRPQLDGKAVTELIGITMNRKTMEASTVARDLGEFTAIAASWTLDRDGEQIKRGAFEKTIDRWRASGRPIPLHWMHQGGNPAYVIGEVDPFSMRETASGLYVEGKLDLEESEVARETWRSMKKGTLALSFGFLTTKERKRADGVKELLELDVYEVSIVSAPANPDTRFLSLKSERGVDGLRQRCRELGIPVPSDEELRARRVAKAKATRRLRRRSWELVLETALGGPVPEYEPELDPTPAEQTAALRRQLRELMS